MKNQKANKLNDSAQIDDQSPVSPMADEPQQDQQVADLTADIQRLQAEFINYKNRVEQEKAQLGDYAKSQVVKDLLPVIDDLERALVHLPENLKEDKWAQGVQKVHSRLIKQLDKLGITKIDALNQPFDHNLHEAVQIDGEGEHQIVSEVLQNGYRLGDYIIRHAVVKVTNT